MNEDPWNCRHEYIQEMIEYTLRQLHEVRECRGPPECGYCLDEQQQQQPKNEGREK